ICHRNPIHLAQCFAALSRIADGRVIMGMGLGGFPHEFAAAGLPSTTTERAYLAKINADLCRMLWAGERVSHKDSYYNFQDVELKPAGPPDDIVRQVRAYQVLGANLVVFDLRFRYSDW